MSFGVLITTPVPANPVAFTPTFEPAPSCTRDIYYAIYSELTCGDGNGSMTACRYFHLGPTTSTSDCFPASWTPTSGAFISPGACPGGYTIACAYSSYAEHRATCCPSGYTCQTHPTSFPWYTSDLCWQSVPDYQAWVYTTRTPGEDYRKVTTTGLNPGAINAYGVEIRWQSFDSRIPILGTITDQMRPTPSSTSSIQAESTTSRVTPDPTQTPPNLSKGAIVGIAVGAVIVLALALVGAFIVGRRWRGRSQRDGGAVAMSQPTTTITPEYINGNGEGVLWVTPQPYYAHEEPQELLGRSEPVELH